MMVIQLVYGSARKSYIKIGAIQNTTKDYVCRLAPLEPLHLIVCILRETSSNYKTRIKSSVIRNQTVLSIIKIHVAEIWPENSQYSTMCTDGFQDGDRVASATVFKQQVPFLKSSICKFQFYCRNHGHIALKVSSNV